MIINNIKLSLRSLSKNKLYTALNILGLSVGIGAGLLILLWVRNEYSYDAFHNEAERIYRINAHFDSGGKSQSYPQVPAAHGPFAIRELPECDQAVRFTQASNKRMLRYGDKQFIEDKGAVVDTAFFTMFNFKLIKGDPKKPFLGANSIVLTETFAKKYFGDEDPIGKTLLQGAEKEPLEVTGILADFPANTRFSFDFCFSIERAKARFRPNDMWKTLETNFGDFNYFTYLKIKPGANLQAIEQKINKYQHDNNIYDKTSWYTLQALSQTHLIGADGKDAGARTARAFLVLGILTLVIACINYINLTTARAARRAREVGIRKVNGAEKGQLFGQFMAESALITTSAFTLGLLGAYALLPACNKLMDQKIAFHWSDPGLWLFFGSIWLGITFLSGIYPAVVIARFQPLQVMRGKITTAKAVRFSLRRVLVVAQFCFSIFLIAGTLVIGKQMRYMQQLDLGYNRDNVLSFEQNQWMEGHSDAILAEIAQIPGVKGVAYASDDIVQTQSATGDTDWDGKAPDQNMMVNQLSVDENFVPALGLQLLEGRNFLGKGDSTNYILSESAVKEMGITDPIGKRFALHNVEGSIVGVVKEVFNGSIKEAMRPTVICRMNDWFSQIYVKIEPQRTTEVIESVGAIWARTEQIYPFKYEFLDERFDELYKTEQRTGNLFNIFSAIAILISCLGLFGLSTFTAEQRTKEIGVRKVLGATVASITSLLAKDYLKLVLVALVISTPFAWYLLQEWLSDFAYRIELHWSIFAVAGVLALSIALFTVSFQSVKAALIDPVKSLKND